MTKNSGLSEITPSEWLSLNQFVQELKKINSQCISVYYPYGKGADTIQLLQETSRSEPLKKIEKKIETKILELKKNPISVGKFTKTLCIFGWIKDKKIQIKVIGTSQKLPYVYMLNKKPYLKPFSDILKTNYDVLVVTVDQKTARIQKFHGNQIIQESKLRIDLQGIHKKV
jgi:peptide chain release factor subunit 1